VLSLDKKYSRRFARALVVVFIFSACDTGLAPLNEPSGFRGVVRFQNWPPADSVREIRIVAFEQYPTDSAGILASLIAGTAAVYPELEQRLPRFVDTLGYEFTTKKGLNLRVTNYNYIIVAQQYGPNVFTDWKPAGVYATRPDSFEPAPLRILLHRITPNVDINVDFNNPPPRPWR
jgi:hypothetical protein